jgi:hypothetical protein
LVSLVYSTGTPGVVLAVVALRAFPGFDPLLSGCRLVEHMSEPILEVLTRPIEILALFLGEAFLVSVECFFRVVRIEFVLDVPSGFTDYVHQFQILIGDHRLDFSVTFASADHPSD